MLKFEFEKKYLGKKVKIILFDRTVLNGFLQKTGTEHLKCNPNLYLPKKLYFVSELEKSTEAVKHTIFRFSHITKIKEL